MAWAQNNQLNSGTMSGEKFSSHFFQLSMPHIRLALGLALPQHKLLAVSQCKANQNEVMYLACL